MSIVAEAVQEYDSSRGRGGWSWGWDDDRWSVRHGQQKQSIEDVDAMFALWYYSPMMKRGVSVAEVLVGGRSFRPLHFESQNLMQHEGHKELIATISPNNLSTRADQNQAHYAKPAHEEVTTYYDHCPPSSQ